MNILTKTLIATLAVVSCTAGVQAADVTMNVNGRVLAGACTVSSTLVAGQTVDLGTLGITTFQRAGDADSAWHNFSLELTNCPSGLSSSTVTLAGTPDANNATLFANTEPEATAAKNIAVEVSMQSDNSTILSNGSTMTVDVNTTEKTATFPLAARMKTPVGNGQAGKLSSTVLVSFTYQ